MSNGKGMKPNAGRNLTKYREGYAGIRWEKKSTETKAFIKRHDGLFRGPANK